MNRIFAILWLLLLSWCVARLTAQPLPPSKERARDSLEQLLATQTRGADRLHTLIDLSDVVPPSIDKKYTLQLLEEGRKAHNYEALAVALPKLAWWEYYSGNDKQMMAYLAEMRHSLPPDVGNSLAILVECVADAQRLKDNDDEQCDELIQQILESDHKADGIYESIQKVNLMIVANDRLHALNPLNALHYQREMLRYQRLLYDLAKKLPYNYGSNMLRQHALSLMVLNPALSDAERDRWLLRLVDLVDEMMAMPEVSKRRWYTRMIEVSVNSELLVSDNIDDEQRKAYLDHCLDLIDEDQNNCPLRPIEYAKARYRTRYYEHKDHLSDGELHDYEDALMTCIELGPAADAVTDRVHLATIYEQDGRYQSATEMLQEMFVVRDSLHTLDNEELTLRLQTEYGVALHQLENAQLKASNQRNLITGCCVLIGLLAFWLMYAVRVSVRERRLNRLILESETMKKLFISSMCHEIRTPLNIISGNSQVIAMGGLDPATRSAMVDGMQAQTDMLTKILDDMLNVALLDSSHEFLPVAPTDLHQLMQMQIERCRCEAPDYTWVLAGDDVGLVNTKAQYLAVTIDILLNNVSTHCPPGTTCVLRYEYDAQAHELTIVCEDNGPGIPSDKLEEVFMRFTKLNEFVPGTGLGLYLCRLVVTRLRGSIEVDGGYIPGTRMVIKLPA